ncbi:GFA family protein [Poseidonocella sedimentorum]|uniref:Uncharacterized conserved protein n=1 Tax=Poseidonocella sedimentorum TaxID=871652 RepID=A0A1I6E9R5_9RHOB|nr:GFA family protein [Poseidonocella sedimentorum]SFR14301.1 Uncharacterized conserved protein [Poseidonocella sedimentorum]
MLGGSCACGAVAFELHGPLRPVFGCHCTTCRKTSGHFWAATAVASEGLILRHEEALGWFRSSVTSERGFCRSCGSSLFYRVDGAAQISVAAGALDGDTGLHTAMHIFTADMGDYYGLEDGVSRCSGGVSPDVLALGEGS